MTITATQSNRHNRLDHTPYEGKTLIGGPSEVYIRGALAYRDGEVVAEPGQRALRRARVPPRGARRPPCARGTPGARRRR